MGGPGTRELFGPHRMPVRYNSVCFCYSQNKYTTCQDYTTIFVQNVYWMSFISVVRITTACGPGRGKRTLVSSGIFFILTSSSLVFFDFFLVLVFSELRLVLVFKILLISSFIIHS